MDFSGFDLDIGNVDKCQSHGVLIETIESVFRRPIIVSDPDHSQTETRFRAVGRIADGRLLFVVFTIRRLGHENLLRPISARYMHPKKRAYYEEAFFKL